MSNKKTVFIQLNRLIANDLAEIMKKVGSIYPVYFACGYNADGANPITNQDLINAGIPEVSEGVPEILPEDIAGLINLMGQLQNFAGNQPVTQGDYLRIVSVIRSDA